MVVQGRVQESLMMESEELLTHFDSMRSEKQHFHKLFDQQASLALERQHTIDKLSGDYAENERKRLECKEDKDTQTIIGAKYFENKKRNDDNMNSSRNNSGSVQSSSRTQG